MIAARLFATVIIMLFILPIPNASSSENADIPIKFKLLADKTITTFGDPITFYGAIIPSSEKTLQVIQDGNLLSISLSATSIENGKSAPLLCAYPANSSDFQNIFSIKSLLIENGCINIVFHQVYLPSGKYAVKMQFIQHKLHVASEEIVMDINSVSEDRGIAALSSILESQLDIHGVSEYSYYAPKQTLSAIYSILADQSSNINDAKKAQFIQVIGNLADCRNAKEFEFSRETLSVSQLFSLLDAETSSVLYFYYMILPFYYDKIVAPKDLIVLNDFLQKGIISGVPAIQKSASVALAYYAPKYYSFLDDARMNIEQNEKISTEIKAHAIEILEVIHLGKSSGIYKPDEYTVLRYKE